MKDQSQPTSVYDTSIRLFFLALIVAWCFLIILPFGSIILWSIILAVAFKPLHHSLSGLLKGNEKLAATLIVLISLIVLFLPGALFMSSIVEGAKKLKESFDAGTLSLPAPSEKVKDWPIIGDKIYALWISASADLAGFAEKYREQIAEYGAKIAKGFMGIVSGGFQLIASIIIAGFLLVIKGSAETFHKTVIKIAGEKGDEFADIAYQTIGNVVKGILGVAFIQAILTGLGFVFAGVPYPGLWALIVLIFAILQLPAIFIVLPVVIWMFSELETMPAVLWTVYLLIAGLSDNVLKPILLGKGAPVPMLVIFLGVIGGFILSGFIGLFTGAIVMSLGYKLFQAWVD